MKKLLIICGPTAVGKSALALSLAEKLNTEIISADAMQIYKGLDIGTAKPTKEEQKLIKHNLIDIVNPDEEFSVFDYVENCKGVIERFDREGKVPLIVGGTGFYIKSLLFSYNFSDANKNAEIRDKLNEDLKNYGNDYIYQKLIDIDPESAEVLHKNDTKRVIRALEIYYSTGIKKSEAISAKSRYDYCLIGLNTDRTELYERINLRVAKMIELGLVKEVENLLNLGYYSSLQSMQAIGYKEIIGFLNKEYSLDAAIEKIKQATRNYAKRQITYFKSISLINWLYNKGTTLEKNVLNLYNSTN